MSTHVIPVESPIDTMYLLHDALRAEAAHVEQLVSQLQEGGTLQPLRQAFYRWTMGLAYHADTEDTYMTPLLPDVPAARDCEQAHQRLADRLEEVQHCLTEEIGRTMLIARTQRHLFGAVVLARIAQDDHLEEEEAFILPVIRRQLSTTQQAEVIAHLLIDQEAEDPRWHLDWLQETLPPREGQFVADLAAQIRAGCPREQLVPAMPRA
jgi:hemerythrin-like domain-containing protein